MSDADRPGDETRLSSCPERDAMVATLLGITPERLRTLRRVHRKRAGSAKPAGWAGPPPQWQRVDRMDDDALFATFRQREVRARAGIAAPVHRLPRRTIGQR